MSQNQYEAYQAELIAEVKATVAAAIDLTEAPAGTMNILTAVQAAQRSFINELIDERLQCPLVIIELGRFTGEKDRGVDSWGMKRIPVTIHVVTRVGGEGGTQEWCFGQAMNICMAIDDPSKSFNTFEVEELGDVNSGHDAPINIALLSDGQAGVISACVTWSPGWLVNFTPQ